MIENPKTANMLILLHKNPTKTNLTSHLNKLLPAQQSGTLALPNNKAKTPKPWHFQDRDLQS